MNKGKRVAIALAGLSLTPIYWGLVLMFAAGAVLGDCTPGSSCLTETGRKVLIIASLTIGTGIYGAAVGAWRRLDDRLARPDQLD